MRFVYDDSFYMNNLSSVLIGFIYNYIIGNRDHKLQLLAYLEKNSPHLFIEKLCNFFRNYLQLFPKTIHSFDKTTFHNISKSHILRANYIIDVLKLIKELCEGHIKQFQVYIYK